MWILLCYLLRVSSQLGTSCMSSASVAQGIANKVPPLAPASFVPVSSWLGLVQPFPLALGAFHWKSCSLDCPPGMSLGLCSSSPWAAGGRGTKPPVGSQWEQRAWACGSWESAVFPLPGGKSGTAVLLELVTRRMATQKPLLLFLCVCF